MAVIFWLMGLAMLIQGSFCSPEQTKVGCKTWTTSGENVCCEECHEGNRLVKKCGPRPQDLCKPCDAGTFAVKGLADRCHRCTQCIGDQTTEKKCTAMSDTKCGCGPGFVCGNEHCSFCIEKCDKGYEPSSDRSCTPCPDGYYNDKGHQKCKPWSKKCPGPDQVMVAKGNTTSDIQCVSQVPVVSPKKPDDQDQAMPLALTLIIGMVLMASIFITIIIFIFVTLKSKRREKKPEKPDSKTPIIRPPTDDPRTLIAVECSFNEAQQEQGSSTESLISKQPAGQFIA